MDVAAAHLLDFSKPFDCSLLDQIVTIWSDGANPQRPAADAFLQRLRENPDMWKRADAILETSKNEASKFFILMVLKETINTRWKVIPIEQREGIRNYIVGKIVALSASNELMLSHGQILSQLNQTLVAILKQDWPHAWPTFIGDIVGSSKTSESLCENNMKILKLLSEDVFLFSAESMTAAKIKQMKESLNEQFSQVFQLCLLVMENSQKPSLLLCTLDTLQRFLTWIPLGYIFETSLIAELTKFFQVAAFRTVTLDCLTEIASLPAEDIPETYKPVLLQLFVHIVTQLSAIVGHADLADLYEKGTDEDCLFISRLALFLGTFLRSFLHFFDQSDGGISHQAVVIEAMNLLLRISNVNNEDVFKTCLEFWGHFAKEMFTKGTLAAAAADAAARGGGGPGSFGRTTSGSAVMGGSGFQPLGGGGGGGGGITSNDQNGALPVYRLASVLQHSIYHEVLHRLRITMIDHMAKPEEVIIVEDDSGEIVREQTKDTEVIAQYKTMREAIVYLTHLNFDDTESIMADKLDYQVADNGRNFTWGGLNTLCWAIGSISGAMGELDEKRFLVAVIRDLLKLCEEQKGKDNKAVVASNIMYIVGQYPRFLRAHWKFLKTVVNKLFEFMHEHHPGVQDMACDTFLKIAQKCKRKFMTPQTEDPVPFIVILIRDIRRHTADLATHQVLSFYESVGTMLSDHGPPISQVLQREEVVLRLMDVTNETWRRVMLGGQHNPTNLTQKETIKELSTCLRINNRVCQSAGSIYAHQLSIIFLDMLNLYRFYGEQIKEACQTQGDISARYSLYKSMRSVKSDILELMSSFFEASRDIEGGPQSAMPVFLPPLMDEVLGDYRAGPSAARDAKVLSLFCTVVSVLRNHVSAEVPRIMDAIFEPTLEMITSNMLDNPDHRIGFFKFLREANEHCFYGLFSISAAHQKLVIDSIVWAFKHTERNICETGLEILQELLQNIVVANNPQFAQPFYSTFLLSLIQEVLGIMTDRLHKSSFKLQAGILMHLFHLVQNGKVVVPLFDPATVLPNITDNAHFLKEHVARLLLEAFPNLSTAQIVSFVSGLFDVSKDINAFKQHLRDFLVTYNVHENEDNSLYYEEEKHLQQREREMELRQYQESIPGLLKPSELAEEQGVGDDF